MLIELNRLMTAADVQRHYQLPDGLFKELLPKMPVYHREGGQELYLESHIDQFLHRLRAGLDDEDRMIPPDRVRLDKKEYENLSSLEWRLLDILLGAKDRAVVFQDAVDHVYGHEADDKDGSLRQGVKHLNEKLTDQDCPFTIRFKNGYVYLDL